MKTTTKYLCGICEHEYSTEPLALACEGKGFPQETAHIKEGDKIKFWAQHKPMEASSLEDYNEEEGIVLYKFTAFHAKRNEHMDVIVCEVGEGENKIERQMTMMDFEKEGKKLFSPSSWQYKLGWAEGLKQLKKS